MRKVIDEHTEFDPSDLWIGKPHKTLNERYRKSPSYFEIDNYKKLWIKTPFVLLPFAVSVLNTKQNSKLHTITAVFNPLTKRRKTFLSLIDSIDDVIEERVGGILGKEYKYRRSVDRSEKSFFKHKMSYSLPKDKNGADNFVLYNNDKEKKTIEDLVPNTKMIALIELFEIVIDDEEKKYYTSWNIKHGKIFQDVSIEKTT